MPEQVTPFLMSTGDAERAIELYTSLFDDARLLALTRFGADGTGVEGTVERARPADRPQSRSAADPVPAASSRSNCAGSVVQAPIGVVLFDPW